MCRFIAYLGEPILLSHLIHEPENSLINQSHHAREREEPLNGDGFGLAWYAPEITPIPARFRSVRPAWNDLNLRSLCRSTVSHCAFAHVRAATRGDVAQTSCHPFRFGSLLMMHNGDIGGFERIKRKMRRELPDDVYSWIHGQTDSEHFFAMMLAALDCRDDTESLSVAEVATAFRRAFHRLIELRKEEKLAEPLFLNTVITNGKWMLASRYTSDESAKAHTLYYSVGEEYDCSDGVCTMRGVQKESSTGSDRGAVLIVSEKLTDDGKDWTPVPQDNMVMVDKCGTGFEVQVGTLQ